MTSAESGGRVVAPATPAGDNRRLFLVALVIAVVAATIGSAYSYVSARREMTTAALAKRENTAYLVATVMTEKFDRLVDIGVSLSTRVRFMQLLEDGKWDEAIQIMRRVPMDFPFIERLFLADPGGVLRVDTPVLPGVRGRDFSERDWYRGAMRTGAPYVSSVYRRAAPPQINVVAVAVPIKNRRDTLMAVLVLQVRLEAFFDWFRRAPDEGDWHTYIVDRNGQTAYHPDIATAGETTDLTHMPVVQKVLRGESGVAISRNPDDAQDRVTAYAPVHRYGWGVVIDQPAASAFAARNAQLRRLVAVYVVVLALSAFALLLLLRARSAARATAVLAQRVADRTAELETVNQELEAFSYSVSHDLRAPLRSIDGFSQILLQDCAERLDERHRGYLQRVRSGTQRMGALIDDLIKLSRVTRAEMHAVSVDLSALARAVVEELRSREPERDVSIDIQPNLKASGDRELLHIMLDNLIGNAWKFTGRTASARIAFGAETDTSGARHYFVRDNGAGFDAQYAHKLFHAFQRLHHIDEFPGTGIGLATVQRIVRRHGGRVWAESPPGGGATFRFTLPDSSGSAT